MTRNGVQQKTSLQADFWGQCSQEKNKTASSPSRCLNERPFAQFGGPECGSAGAAWQGANGRVIHHRASEGLAIVDVLDVPLDRLSPPAVLGHVRQRRLSKHAILQTQLDSARRVAILINLL